MVVQGNANLITTRLYPIYGAILFVVWLGSILLCFFMTQDSGGPFQRDSFDVQTSIYASLGFGFAVTCTTAYPCTCLLFSLTYWCCQVQGIYAYKTFTVLSSIALTEKGRTQVQRYMIIISIYLAVFMVRTVWNLTNYLHLNLLQDLFYNLQQQGSALCWTIYISYYILLEILPIVGITFLLSWMSRSSLSESAAERKPILGAPSSNQQSENAPAPGQAPKSGIPVDRAAMDINRGADSRPNSYSSTDGTDSTLTSPLRIDAKDLVDSEPSSLSSSLGQGWGRMRRHSSSSDEEGSVSVSVDSSRIDLDDSSPNS